MMYVRMINSICLAVESFKKLVFDHKYPSKGIIELNWHIGSCIAQVNFFFFCFLKNNVTSAIKYF